MAIVGGGPAGLACAIKLMQLLEDEPELSERLGEVPVAVVEKGKVAGAHLLSGANMRPSAMRELFPDLDPSEWPVYQEVTKDAVYFLTSKAAFPLKPMPPNFRNHGNYVTSVSKLGRFLGGQGGGGRRLPARRDRRDQAPGGGPDRPGCPLRRSRSRQGRGGAGELRARLGPGGQGDGAGRGDPWPPHLRGARLLRPARGRPAALGARREGGLGGPRAARPGDPYPRLAAALERQVRGGGRQLHLPDGGGQGLPRAGGRPRLHAMPPSAATTRSS